MKAYNNDKKLKERFIAELQKHYDADQIVRGTYGQENGTWKGCAVACSLRSLDVIDSKDMKTKYGTHKEYETRLGIPEAIAHLEDKIFEELPADKAKDWALRFGKAVPVGADLSLVTPKFLFWLLNDEKQYADERGSEEIDTVIGLYQRVISGEDVPQSEFEATGAAAGAAAAAAAAAAEPVWAARAAAWAARAGKYEEMADKLVELLEEAPVR